ncbi:MAG: hypothetical protein ABFD58_12260, partial [Anaerolineaceae bacterium]
MSTMQKSGIQHSKLRNPIQKKWLVGGIFIAIFCLAFVFTPVSADDGSGNEIIDPSSTETEIIVTPTLVPEPIEADTSVIEMPDDANDLHQEEGQSAIEEAESLLLSDVQVVDEVTSDLDPYFNRNGQVFYFRANCSGYSNCLESDAPISSAVSDVISNGLPDDGVINVEGGDFGETLEFGALPGALTLRGGVDGQTSNINGRVFVSGNNSPLTFENFVFNGNVNVLDAQNVSFIDSVFNGSFVVNNTHRLVLEEDELQSSAVVTQSTDLSVEMSLFRSEMLVSNVVGFSIKNSAFLTGLVVDHSRDGEIIDSHLEGWLQTRGSKVSFISTTSPESLAVEMDKEANHLVVEGVNDLKVSGVDDGIEELLVQNGQALLGESNLVFDPADIADISFSMSGSNSGSINVNGLDAASANLGLSASNIVIQNTVNVNSVAINGGGVFIENGGIYSQGVVSVISNSLLINSSIVSAQSDILLNAVNGVTLGENAFVSGKQVMINADTNKDGTGAFVMKQGSVIKGVQSVEIRAADMELMGLILAEQGQVSLINSNLFANVSLGIDGEGFNLSQAEFNLIDAAQLNIGEMESRGEVLIGALDLSNKNYDLSIFGGNMAVGQIVLFLAGTLQMIAAGYIQNRGNAGKDNFIIPGGTLKVKALGFGTASSPMQMSVDFFSALVNCVGSVYVSDLSKIDLPDHADDGIYVSNHGDLTIGGQNGETGLTSGGEIIISTAGALTIAAPIQSDDLVRLTAFQFVQNADVNGRVVEFNRVPDPHFTTGGTENHTYVTIQEAINAVKGGLVPDGGIIILESATFTENVVIDGLSGLIFQLDSGFATLDGTLSISNSSNIAFNGINFTGLISLINSTNIAFTGTSGDDTYAVSFDVASSFTVDGAAGADTLQVSDGQIDHDLPAALTSIETLNMGENAVLRIEIGGTTAGTQYDQFAFNGTLIANGTLQIAFINSFLPSDGNTFDVISATTLSGHFDTAKGLFGFGTNTYYLTVSQPVNTIRLNTNTLIDLGEIIVGGATSTDNDKLGQFLNIDYFGLGTFTITASLDIKGFFSVTNATLTIQNSIEGLTLAGGATVTANTWRFSGNGLNAFAGINGGTANATGLSLSNVNFGVVIMKETSGSYRKWVALKATADNVAFIGFSDIEVSGSGLTVVINTKTSDDSVVDFSGIHNMTAGSITLDMDGADGQLIQVSGTVTISILDFLSLSGTFTFEKKSSAHVNVLPSGWVDKSEAVDTVVDALVVGAAGASGFLGTNGKDIANRLGITLTGVDFGLAILSNATQKWVALKASVDGASLTGIDGISLVLNTISVEINRKSADASIVDFSTTSVTAGSVVIDFDASLGQLTRAGGTITTFSLYDFLQLSGSLSFEKSSGTIYVLPAGWTNQETDRQTVIADQLLISGSNLSGFAGLNGGTANAQGLTITDVSLALAMFTGDASDMNHPLQKWISLSGSLGSASFDGIDNLTLALSNGKIQVNQQSADGSIVDYTNGHSLSIGSETIDFDGASGELLRVSGTINLKVYNFFQVNGSLAIEKKTASVKLDDSSIVNTDLLTIGGNGLSAMVGLNAGSADQVGLNLTGVNFALVMLTDKADATRSWLSLFASADSGGLVGINGLTLSGTDLAVYINLASHDGRVVDYKTQNLEVATGTGTSLILTMDGASGKLAKISGALNLNFFDFFSVSGSIAIEKKSGSIKALPLVWTDKLTDLVTVAVDELLIGGNGLTAFAGINGGTANAVGLNLTNVSFGLAILVDQSVATRKWASRKATAGGISLVGISGLTLNATTMDVEINRPANDNTVVDYASQALEISTGTSSSLTLDMDGGEGALARASGSLHLNVANFFVVDGDFAFEKKSGTIQVLPSGGTVPSEVTVNELLLGGNNVSAFAGINGGTADAIGLNLGGVNFALAIMNDST